MEILEIFDRDLKEYERRFMEAAKGREVIDTDFGYIDGIYWIKLWVK